MPAKYLRFKPEVQTSPQGLRRLARVAPILLGTAPRLHDDVVLVTSANDSDSHHRGSLHYVDAAFDIRTHPNPDGSPRVGCVLDPNVDEAVKVWVGHIKRFLATEDPGWEVIYEAQKQHIHLEFDPK